MGIIADRAQKRLAVVASSDAEYLAAAEAGDLAKCQAMVDAAAMKSGYGGEDAFDSDGPVSYFRGMSKGDPSTIDSRQGKYGAAVAGYFTRAAEGASYYAKRVKQGEVRRFYLSIENVFSWTMLRESDFRELLSENGFDPEDLDGDVLTENKKFIDFLARDGYDAIETEGNYPYSEICVFDSSQIKSADPITYDDSGNIIPLSKRFNSASNDIRANKEKHTMNLQEKYKALKAAGRISATGRTEEILAEDDWVRVKRMAVPEIEAESYLFMECKRETAVCIVRDADGRYLMRNEATLQSNFTPVPKVMTETLEEGETAEQAVIRGLKEEFGVDPASDPIYLGSINGTFQELHNYHIYLVEGIEPSAADLSGDGDGSRGEDRSNNVFITEDEFAQVKDFISWIAYGMMRNRDTTKENVFEGA